MGLPAASGGRASATRAAKFFICLLCRQVPLGVEGSRLQARQAQPPQQLAHRALVHLNLEPGLDPRLQVHTPPPDHAVLRKVRPDQDQGLQLLQLLAAQRRRAAAAGHVPQALNAVRVVAVDLVAQGLAVHPARLRRKQPGVPVQHHCQGQQPPRLPGVRRPRRRRAKPRAVQVAPRDRNRCHATHPESNTGHRDSHPKQLGNLLESKLSAVGITLAPSLAGKVSGTAERHVQVQLAAMASEPAAVAGWKLIQNRLPELRGRKPIIERANPGKPTLWRLRLDGFDNSMQAQEFCQHVQANGFACVIAEF